MSIQKRWGTGQLMGGVGVLAFTGLMAVARLIDPASNNMGTEPRGPTSPWWAGSLLAVLVLGAFQAEIWLVGDPSLVTPSVVSLVAGMSLALVIRSRMPLISTVLVSACYVALLRLAFMPANSYLMVVVIVLITAYSSGHHPVRPGL
jgi:hypothetical protein